VTWPAAATAARYRWRSSCAASAAGGAAVGVGEERVLQPDGGQRALGEPEDHEPLEGEPGHHRQRPHQHAFAEAARPAQGGVERGVERPAEHVDVRGRPAHGVEAPERFEGDVDAVSRPLLLGGPVPAPAGRPEGGAEQLGGAAGQLGPVAGCGHVPDPLAQVVHERRQLAGAHGLGPPVGGEGLALIGLGLDCDRLEAGLVGGEADVPVVPLDHAGIAGDALPRPIGHRTAVGEHRRAGQQTHHVGAAERALGQGEEGAHRPARHAVAHRAQRGAVDGYPGRTELGVDQAGVGVGRAPDDGHPRQRHTGARGVDDHPHRGAHLLVGIGRRHDGVGQRR